ncbi:hypothetical protein BHM03_00012316 [Ensete ventricosum]|nr:hypothetical protein BHM03_00012316 [Ensete ventricosum]
MSSTSSHSESRSVKVSTHRSRILSRPSRDSGSTAIVLSSRGATPINLGAMDALATMQLFFNVDSIVTTHQLKEARKNYFIPSEYELHTPLYGESPYDTFLNGFSLSTDALEAGLRFPLHPMIEVCLEGWQIFPSQMAPNSWRYLINGPTNNDMSTFAVVADSLAEKRPNVDEGLSMRKRYWRETFEHLADASGSTTRVPAEKGKEPVVIEEAPEWGYTLRELCEVEDRAGAEKYFANVMMRLKVTEGEDPLMPRWSISASSRFWIEGPLSGEYLRGVLHPALVKQMYEYSSEELMNRASKLTI